ncbi:MAG: SWIM zinc finger family protein [Kiritimatiellia bacterium]
MAVLENFYMGAELPRGRAYAQAGQVLDIDIAHQRVTAQVQGSQKKPYTITIQFKPAAMAAGKNSPRSSSSQAIFAAAARRPDARIHRYPEEHGLSLFPGDIKDLQTTCTCSGPYPCKHMIAVYYLLAEEFDRDPFLFMKLRGLDRDSIDSIGATPKKEKHHRKKADFLIGDFNSKQLIREMPLSEDATHYWTGHAIREDKLGDVRVPPTPGALSKNLGHFPMWRGGEERFSTPSNSSTRRRRSTA